MGLTVAFDLSLPKSGYDQFSTEAWELAMHIQDTPSSGEGLGLWWTGSVARDLGFSATTVLVQEGTLNV